MNSLLLCEVMWLVGYQRTISVIVIDRTLFYIKLMWNLMFMSIQLIEEISWIYRVLLLDNLIMSITCFFSSFFLPCNRFRCHRSVCHFFMSLRLRIKMRQEIIIRFTFFLMNLSLFIWIINMMLNWFYLSLMLLFLDVVCVGKMLSIIKFFFLLVRLLLLNIVDLFLMLYFLILLFFN